MRRLLLYRFACPTTNAKPVMTYLLTQPLILNKPLPRINLFHTAFYCLLHAMYKNSCECPSWGHNLYFRSVNRTHCGPRPVRPIKCLKNLVCKYQVDPGFYKYLFDWWKKLKKWPFRSSSPYHSNSAMSLGLINL